MKRSHFQFASNAFVCKQMVTIWVRCLESPHTSKTPFQIHRGAFASPFQTPAGAFPEGHCVVQRSSSPFVWRGALSCSQRATLFGLHNFSEHGPFWKSQTDASKFCAIFQSKNNSYPRTTPRQICTRVAYSVDAAQRHLAHPPGCANQTFGGPPFSLRHKHYQRMPTAFLLLDWANWCWCLTWGKRCAVRVAPSPMPGLQAV